MFKEILDEIMLYEPKTKKNNEIIILVGLPGSGKDTFLTENSLRDSHTIISRDDELVKYCEGNNIKGTYNEQWKLLSDAEHKIIDNNTYSNFIAAVKNKENIIINQTNMSVKSRRKWLANVGKDYNKNCILFQVSLDKVIDRNKKRDGKTISKGILFSMMKGFKYPSYDEFDNISIVTK